MMVALTGIEPVLSALRGRRVNQLHHSATVQGILYHIPVSTFNAFLFSLLTRAYGRQRTRNMPGLGRYWLEAQSFKFALSNSSYSQLMFSIGEERVVETRNFRLQPQKRQLHQRVFVAYSDSVGCCPKSAA
jgi:hypothetical protein